MAASSARREWAHPGSVIGAVAVVSCVVVGAAASQGVAAGAAAVALVALGLMLLRSPAVAGYLLVGLVPVVSGLKRDLPVPGFRLSEVLIVLLAGLVLLTIRRRPGVRWRAFDWVALAYVVATPVLGVLDTVLRGDSLSGDDVGMLAGPLQFLLIYHAVRISLPDAAQRLKAFDVALAASLPVSVIALLQAVDFPGVRAGLAEITGADFSERLEWTILRASGPFDHWTMLSGYLLAIVLLCTAALLHRRDRWGRRLALVALGPAAAALILTVTIAPMVGALVGVLLIAAWSRRLLRTASMAALAATVLGLAFAPVLAERAEEQFGSGAAPSTQDGGEVLPATLSNRVDIWTQQYAPVVARNLLTGYGPQTPPNVTWPYSESIYLTMLLRGGVTLLAVFLALLYLGARMAREGLHAGVPHDRALANASYALTLMMAVIMTIVPYFVASGLPHLWWALMALVWGVAAQSTNGAGRPSPRRSPASRAQAPSRA